MVWFGIVHKKLYLLIAEAVWYQDAFDQSKCEAGREVSVVVKRAKHGEGKRGFFSEWRWWIKKWFEVERGCFGKSWFWASFTITGI